MNLAVVATTLAIATAASALIATAVSLPFTPARYWSRRLRKHMETVNALDPVQHKAQRDALMPQANDLANNAAAAYRVPTSWIRFALTIVLVGWLVGSLVTSIVAWSQPNAWEFRNPNSALAVTIFLAPAPLITWVALMGVVMRSFGDTRRQRARFIKKGCPAGYVARMPSEKLDIRSRRYDRCLRLRRTGIMPAEWPPHSWHAGLLRKVLAWRREQPWYKGGFIR